MQILILSALLTTLTTPAAPQVPAGWTPVVATPRAPATAPMAQATTRSTAAPATPAHYRPYQRYQRYQPRKPYRTYRPYRPYRPYRRSPSYRERRFADNFLKKGGMTFSVRGGYHDLFSAPGGFAFLQPRGNVGYTFGWNISPFVHFGLGVDTFLYGQQGQLGQVKSLAQTNVTMDLIVRLIRPSDRRYVVPFLQLGVGLALLSGSKRVTETTEGCDGEPETTETTDSVLLSRGGILQVGGGVEFYLTRWISLGVRGLYRVQPMSGIRCLDGPKAACDPSGGPSQVNLQGFSADASLTFHFMSI